MNLLFKAIILGESYWLLLTVVFVGVGFIASCFFKPGERRSSHFFDLFWLGFFWVIIILQFWQLFLKIGEVAAVFVLILGILGFLLFIRSHSHLFQQLNRYHVAFSLSICLLSLFLADRALLPPLNGDSSLYHASAVQWASLYPVIPGLGNLHGRLAFNNANFLVVALLQAISGAKAYHLLNGLLLLLLLGEIVYSYIHFIRSKSLSASNLFYLFIFYPVLVQTVNVYELTSPSLELPILVVTLVITTRLLRFLEEKKTNWFLLLLIFVIALGGITIKLSFLGYASGIIGVVLVHLRMIKVKIPQKIIVSIVVLGGCSLGIWLVRGVILSGYLLYPSSIGAFPVEWRVPLASTKGMEELIKGWARDPGDNWELSLAGWQWLGPWLKRTIFDLRVAVPLLVVFLSGLVLVLKGRRKSGGKKKSWYLLMFPPILALSFWFVSAPAIRFGAPYFLVLAIVSMILFCIRVSKKSLAQFLPWGLSFYLFFSLFEIGFSGEKDFLIDSFRQKGFLKAVSNFRVNRNLLVGNPGEDDGFYPTPKVTLKPYRTDSELEIYYPGKDDQCWDNILCTPYPNRSLKLRDSYNLSKGFSVIERDETLIIGIDEP